MFVDIFNIEIMWDDPYIGKHACVRVCVRVCVSVYVSVCFNIFKYLCVCEYIQIYRIIEINGYYLRHEH